ncbi:hypothetical protein [Prevotella sp.]|uniref:hypothetical protein n=1 Tax=Prevotella sp. TaxID=59823 RepID=UPI003AB7A59A
MSIKKVLATKKHDRHMNAAVPAQQALAGNTHIPTQTQPDNSLSTRNTAFIQFATP